MKPAQFTSSLIVTQFREPPGIIFKSKEPGEYLPQTAKEAAFAAKAEREKAKTNTYVESSGSRKRASDHNQNLPRLF